MKEQSTFAVERTFDLGTVSEAFSLENQQIDSNGSKLYKITFTEETFCSFFAKDADNENNQITFELLTIQGEEVETNEFSCLLSAGSYYIRVYNDSSDVVENVTLTYETCKNLGVLENSYLIQPTHPKQDASTNLYKFII
jgi:hypothetical protein